MTEKIQLKIKHITTKVIGLQDGLNTRVEEINQLKVEIDGLKETIGRLNQLILEKESDLDEMSRNLSWAKEQHAPSANDTSADRSIEIDELVKEIEFCISQLKK